MERKSDDFNKTTKILQIEILKITHQPVKLHIRKSSGRIVMDHQHFLLKEEQLRMDRI